MALPGRTVEELGRCAERTVGSLKQLDTLVNDMLAFAHGGAARETVSVSALLEQVAQWLRPALKRGVRLTIRTQAPQLTVRANAPSLVSAVLNLATNALQAASGDLDPRAAGAPRAPGRAQIVVSDNGPGVPEGIRERIFEPFFTTRVRGQRHRPRHRQIRGRGAPRKRLSARGRARRRVPDRSSGGVFGRRGRGLRMREMTEFVLVVEDDAALREALVDTLRAANLAALAAHDAPEALRMLDSEPVALVISDVHMPGPDGYQLLGLDQAPPAGPARGPHDGLRDRGARRDGHARRGHRLHRQAVSTRRRSSTWRGGSWRSASPRTS